MSDQINLTYEIVDGWVQNFRDGQYKGTLPFYAFECEWKEMRDGVRTRKFNWNLLRPDEREMYLIARDELIERGLIKG